MILEYRKPETMITAEERRLTAVRPSARQLHIEEMEFYAFIHFGMNTFTDREWGDGTEQPALFNPEKLDAAQWARSIRAAGMKGAILTCKHHDGFCLWPSAYTEHSVKNAPWKDGKGDVVREVADALRAEGLAFGVYLSPWDRHEPCYGSGEAYNDYFVNQLTELLTGYGPLFCVWFDGACGEGPNGKKQVYDWLRFYETVRKYQPEACISVAGPDVRWCGNEAGVTRAEEWSVVSARLSRAELVADKSQKTDDAAFRTQGIRSDEEDLGSRKVLKDEQKLIWYPAETNTSIRPGWFYHASEDNQVRSVDNLFDLWLRAVGGNSTLLLNIPPAPDGLFQKPDVEALAGLGARLKAAFEEDEVRSLAPRVLAEADTAAAEHRDAGSDFASQLPARADAAACPELVWELPAGARAAFLVLQEDIAQSQRIERFSVYAQDGAGERCVYAGSTVGYKKVVPLGERRTARIRLRIESCRGGVYLKTATLRLAQ